MHPSTKTKITVYICKTQLLDQSSHKYGISAWRYAAAMLMFKIHKVQNKCLGTILNPSYYVINKVVHYTPGFEKKN